MTKSKSFWFFALIFVALGAAWLYFSKKSNDWVYVDLNDQLNWKIAPATLTERCRDLREGLLKKVDKIEQQDPKSVNFQNTVVNFEESLADFQQISEPYGFYKSIGSSEEIRKAGDDCETQASKMFVDLFLREKLFALIKTVKENKENLSQEDQQLLDEYYDDFRRNGLELSAEKRKIFESKQKELVDLSAEFDTRLAEWKNNSEFTKEELNGVSAEFLEGLAKSKTDPNKYVVTLAYPHYFPIMENTKNLEVRRKMAEKFEMRGGTRNRDILQRAIVLRTEMAQMLGYKTHAQFVLEKKMAKTPEAVNQFLVELKNRLLPIATRDLEELKQLKAKETGKPVDGQLFVYEWRYLANQLKKEKYQVDHEKIKEYFPLEKVLAGMFDIYQTLFDVTFQEIHPAAALWDESVKGYSVTNNQSGKVVATFYMDLFPREGKYGHAAAFTLVSGREIENHRYIAPIASIVANFSAPTKKHPSLLAHDEVETLFHEFGHIMHQVLTTARYAKFSGTNVKGDFVEAPSQMLENWVWKAEALKKLSSHYKTKEPLPDDLVQKMLAAKRASRGIAYTRQLFFATLDMTLHNRDTAATFDTTKVYHDLLQEICMLVPQRHTFPEANFGHLMGGYDAGYYGYLWSEVFAQDMFSRFEQEGLFSKVTGLDYLNKVLQPGGAKDPYKLLAAFLGREPNQQAFLKEFEPSPDVN